MTTGPTNVAGRRTIGYILEAFLDFLVIAGLISLFHIELKVLPSGQVIPADSAQASRITLVALIYIAYWFGSKVVTLSMFGWTPGMLFMELRCVRYDGRPPSLLRAFLRTLFFWGMLYLFGCFFWLALLVNILATKTGRMMQDGVADTFVIDKMAFGHLIVMTRTGTEAGPLSVTREEAEQIARQEGLKLEMPSDPRAKNGKPFFDKKLDTHVIWNEKEQTWRAFDKVTGEWHQIG